MAGHTLTQAMILAYADLSRDHNPLHVDEAIASASPFGGIVAHGFLLLTGALEEVGRRDGFPKALDCRFRSPGRPGETLVTVVDPDGGFRTLCGERLLVEGCIDD